VAHITLLIVKKPLFKMNIYTIVALLVTIAQLSEAFQDANAETYGSLPTTGHEDGTSSECTDGCNEWNQGNAGQPSTNNYYGGEDIKKSHTHYPHDMEHMDHKEPPGVLDH
jgi:hypothetical protein